MCGAATAVAGRGRPARYCSRSCQARAYRRRKQPPPPAPPPTTSPTAPHAPAGRPITEVRERKRRLIAEAVWRIAAEDGLGAASMRRIAAEAGLSLRTVQYHFPGKHALLIDALHLLHAENERIAAARIAPRPGDPGAVVRAVLEEFLPVDAQRDFALRVFAAYYACSLTDPELAAVFLAAEDPLERLVADLVGAAQAEGSVPPDVVPRYEADLLVSGATGLGVDILHGRRTPADARAVLDYHLARIFPARDRTRPEAASGETSTEASGER